MMKKNPLLTKTALLLSSALLVSALAGCTNSEAPEPVSDASGGAAVALGAGGQDAAKAVKADPAVQALLPEGIKAAGSMKLVTDPTYAPIDFTDNSGNIIGLEPDMALAVANKMGIKIEITKGDFNGILAGLESKRYDASWAAFSITPERTAAVDMASYMKGGTSVIVKKGTEGDFHEILDLCGKTVTAQTGTTQALTVMPNFEKACTDAGKKAITPLLLPQQDSANQAIASGRAQAMLADNALTAYYSQIQPDAFAQVDSILVDPSLVGVAMAKGDGKLVKAFSAAIQSLMEDGTYGKIMGAWNLAPSSIEKSEINPTVVG
ncbi:ABC transporter substrate-binding protein [Arthrobacter sp. HY1533]|uniref:ABC transporter substrate-binding protein n=1 Tax=Arthrobacter sp. HY1533 TaxID=2970919 RepID=UPI0022B9FF51|nr:ABC transporter substrate-binding protein [Arthrobacter sp. HY1533]